MEKDIGGIEYSVRAVLRFHDRTQLTMPSSELRINCELDDAFCAEEMLVQLIERNLTSLTCGMPDHLYVYYTQVEGAGK
jgi:hypothetical protein